MREIKWKPEYSMKNEEIDNQHKELIEKMDYLFKNGDKIDEKEIKKIIMSIFKFVKKHFSDEEKLMKQFDYPFLKSHVDEHDKIIEKLNILSNKFEYSEQNVYVFALFVYEIFSEHMLVVDKQYIDFLKDV